MGFDNFYTEHIEPVEKQYILSGALIILFSFIQGAFSESLSRNFLLGLLLTLIFILLFTTLKELLDNGGKSAVSLIYLIFYLVFFYLFAYVSFSQYKSSFSLSAGIILGFLFVIVARDIKNFSIIFFVKKTSNGYVRTFIYLLTGILIFVLFCLYGFYILNVQANCPSEGNFDMSSLTDRQIFCLAGLELPGLILSIFILAMICELSSPKFRKYHDRLTGLKNIMIYRIIMGYLVKIKKKFVKLME